MSDHPEPVVSVHGARDLSPDAREAVEALIDVATSQFGEAADGGGPSVEECADDDARWWGGEKAGE